LHRGLGVFQFRKDVDWGWADAQFHMGKGNAYTQPFNSIEFNGKPLDAAISDVGNHTYTFYYTGDGEKIKFSILDCLITGERGGYDNNAGMLLVEIYPLTTLSVTKLPSLKKYNINHSTCSVSFNIRRYYHIPICFSNRA